MGDRRSPRDLLGFVLQGSKAARGTGEVLGNDLSKSAPAELIAATDHRAKHADGYQTTIEDDGTYLFRTRNGTELRTRAS